MDSTVMAHVGIIMISYASLRLILITFRRYYQLALKIELRCRDDKTRLLAPSSIVCLNSGLHFGSEWFPSKWPSSIPKCEFYSFIKSRIIFALV
uniref:Uncharacterized protein n=1 Tax=Onchocerca volvulus TaxID=6282 RepID=A0A8R1TLM6_ONCVO